MNNKSTTCSFKTLGCKVNQYETQAIRETFLEKGYEEVNGKSLADIYVINTCTVTGSADSQSRNMIRWALKKNPKAKVIVTGCYAEKDREKISKISGVSFIAPNRLKNRLTEFLEGKDPEEDPKTYAPLKISGFKGHSKAFIKIQDGCDNFCSYCKVPYVRGRSASRPLDEIVEETDRILKAGFKEIILTGVCLGAYGRGLKNNLSVASVLEKIIQIDGEFRLRLSSIEPMDISDELVETVKKSTKICKHLHIPLQSGSDDVLKSMRRGYTGKQFCDLISKIKTSVPGISVTTDVIAGFPSETDENFRDTLAVLKEIKPCRIHAFSYSPREGTKALEIKNKVPGGKIKNRMAVLQKLAQESSYSYRKDFLGKKVRVLVETKKDKNNNFTGYSDEYFNIAVKGKAGPGKLVFVKISEVTMQETKGELAP